MNWLLIAQLVFWGALILLGWTFAGYPAVMILLARGKKSKSGSACPEASASDAPRVSVVIAGYNEAKRLPGRIKNLFDTDYPADKFEIIIVSDGSDDDTEAVINAMADERVRLVAKSERSGKSACVGYGIEIANGEIIVLCDARQRFDRQTIPNLIARFAEPTIGAVSGELEIASGGGGVAEGVGAYWKLERKLREAEGILDSTIGCTGAVYAIRKSLFRPIPGDTLLDDVVIPMQVLTAGSRVIFEPLAKAFDPQELTSGSEEVRKQRTLAGNVQLFMRHPQWLLPWRNRCVLQLISHKYLRLAGPFCLIAALIANACLFSLPLYQFTAGAQVTAYVLAIIGKTGRGPRLARLAAAFLFLNIQVLRGIRYYFFGNWRTGWR